VDLDRQLSSQLDKVRSDIGKLGSGGRQQTGDDYGGLLSDSQSVVRVISGGQVIAERGDSTTLPLPTADGLSTVTASGEPWRSLVEPADPDAPAGDRVQVAQSLQPIDERLADNARITAVIAVLGALVAALGAWAITTLIVRPLRRLHTGARDIQPGDPGRLPVTRRPREVADLSAGLNRMLDRLQTSMHATRRFTADAGHELRTPLTSLGMDLETLIRHPDLPATDRDDALAAMVVEHRRIVALLDGLQALARGDTGTLPEHSTVDLPDLVSDAVARAAHRHPEIAFSIVSSAPGTVDGWQAGLLLAVGNLLDNAALHGRPSGTVTVTVDRSGDQLRIGVADDGPGIPAGQREEMKQRFTRGDRPRSGGSGGLLAVLVLPSS
jgi:signal transduction histidine kinase